MSLLSIAPMLDWTDRHCRVFHRLLAPKAVLYTEMVVAEALLHTSYLDKLLGHDRREHPLVLQLGGSDPVRMAAAVSIAEKYGGFAAYNINVGCPSDRVQNGRFGACLMAEPETVAACVQAMRQETAQPITIKTRIGIDEKDSDNFRYAFLDAVVTAGTAELILHARIAKLKGLSPKQNREIPPLRYDVVYAAKQRYPEIPIILNGGVETLEGISQHLEKIDGVMIGRKAWHEPRFLSAVMEQFYHAPPAHLTGILETYAEYLSLQEKAGIPTRSALRPLIGLRHGMTGARVWKQRLTLLDAPASMVLMRILKDFAW